MTAMLPGFDTPPAPPEPPATKPLLVLSEALAQVLHAAPKGGRVYLHGDGKRVSLLAHDDHRATLVDAESPPDWPFFTRSVTVADAKRLVKLAPRAGEWLPWTEVTSWPSVWADLTRDLSGMWTLAAIPDRAPLVAWLREAIGRRDELVYVDVHEDGALNVSLPVGEVDAQPEGVEIGCGVDPRYLLDAVESCPAIEVWLILGQRRLDPLRLVGVGTDWRALVMPRRCCAAGARGAGGASADTCPCRDCTTERAWWARRRESLGAT